MAADDPILRLAAQLEPLIAEAFLAAVRAITDSVRLAALVERIRQNDTVGVFQTLGLENPAFRPLERQLLVGYETGAIDITTTIGLRLRSNARQVFNISDPQVQAFINSYATQLITSITEDQRRLVAEALRPLSMGLDPMLTGDTPQKLALDLVGRINRATGKREGGLIGLSAVQADWSRNYRAELAGVPDAAALSRSLRDKRFDRTIRRAIAEGKALDHKTRQKALDAYNNKALRMRANTIAANEANAVTIRAQEDAWKQAVDRGAVAETRVRRFWVTAQDDHVRPTHRMVPAMNEKGVGLNEEFSTPKGPTLNPGWQFDPGCRCRVRVRVSEGA